MANNTLRVLHLGNVANNAYLNAKLLADAVDSDVLSYAHYHIMGSPEWEDSDFDGNVEEYHPDWRQVDLRGFCRPDWFAEGPIAPASRFLEARRRGGVIAMSARRSWLNFRRDLICGHRWAPLRQARRRARGAAVRPGQSQTAPSRYGAAPQLESHLTARFRDCFPDRRDQLTAADLESATSAHGYSPQQLRALFDCYDLVHAYGAEPVLPLVAGMRPYVAFEHGTLRALPFENSSIGRLTALAYREADAVLITNADNRAAAIRLGLSQYRFVPHPVNEHQPSAAAVTALRRQLHGQLNADFIVFHPSRQHWTNDRNPHLEKGNDRLIAALAQLMSERPRAAAVFVKWGATLDASREMIAQLGIHERVLWIDPVPGPALARYMAAADVVADQFHLGAFGAITPRALFLGIPALLYLDEGAHQWCFPEPPPVLNASEPSAIAGQLRAAYDDREALHAIGVRGSDWYRRYHSNDVVRRILLDTYNEVLGEHRERHSPQGVLEARP